MLTSFGRSAGGGMRGCSRAQRRGRLKFQNLLPHAAADSAEARPEYMPSHHASRDKGDRSHLSQQKNR
jgi:hypothetical protein